jgi:hypothetical protein
VRAVGLKIRSYLAALLGSFAENEVFHNAVKRATQRVGPISILCVICFGIRAIHIIVTRSLHQADADVFKTVWYNCVYLMVAEMIPGVALLYVMRAKIGGSTSPQPQQNTSTTGGSVCCVNVKRPAGGEAGPDSSDYLGAEDQ